MHGIDTSKNMIEYSKNNNPKISDNINQEDMSNYFKNKNTDIALFIAVIHLISPDTVVDIFKNMINNIRGRVVITTREYSNKETGWKYVEKGVSGVFRWKMHYTFDIFNNTIKNIFSGLHLSPIIYTICDNCGDKWLICVAQNNNAISYLNNGYVKLSPSNDFPIDEMKQIYEKAITRNPNESESYLCFGHPNDIVRVERFIPDTIELSEWINNFDFRPFIEHRPTLMKDKFNFKKPGEGSFPPHQDAQSGWPNHNCLTIGIAVDKADNENGCFKIVKGEHTSTHGELKQVLPKEWCDLQDWITVEMEEREIIILHGLCPHKTDENTSNRLRRMVLLTFGDSNYYSKDYYNEFFNNKIKKQPPVHMWDTSKTYKVDNFGKWNQII